MIVPLRGGVISSGGLPRITNHEGLPLVRSPVREEYCQAGTEDHVACIDYMTASVTKSIIKNFSITISHSSYVKVFDVEVASFQTLLSAVHDSAKTVMAAGRGLEAGGSDLSELIRSLANNQVSSKNSF